MVPVSKNKEPARASSRASSLGAQDLINPTRFRGSSATLKDREGSISSRPHVELLGTTTTNVGVVGLGEQGWDNLLPSLAMLKEVNIKAVCDLDPQKVAVASRNYGASSYHDYLAMLDREPLDAVVVASHPAVHAAILKATITRNLPTFVEKPPTLYTRELDELILLNKKFTTATAVGLNFSFTDAVRFLKGMMAKGEFGDLEYVRICHYGNKPSGPIWGLQSTARSFLLSQAIHPLGLLFDLGTETAEEPVIRVSRSSSGLLFNVNMRLEAASGRPFTAELLTTSTSPFFEWQLQLISDRGIMVNINSLWEVEVYSQHRQNSMIDNQKWWRDLWRPSPLSGGFKRNGYEHQFAAFVKGINTNEPNHTRIERMKPIYTLMDKMERAHDN